MHLCYIHFLHTTYTYEFFRIHLSWNSSSVFIPRIALQCKYRVIHKKIIFSSLKSFLSFLKQHSEYCVFLAGNSNSMHTKTFLLCFSLQIFLGETHYYFLYWKLREDRVAFTFVLFAYKIYLAALFYRKELWCYSEILWVKNSRIYAGRLGCVKI